MANEERVLGVDTRGRRFTDAYDPYQFYTGAEAQENADLFARWKEWNLGRGAPDQFESFLPANIEQYNPGQQTGGSFSDWLNSLPSAQQLAPFNQKLRSFGLTPNIVPAMWKAFAPHGEALINKEHMAQLRSLTAGTTNSRREFERDLLGAFQGAGVDPLFAQGQIAERRPGFGYQIEQGQGAIEASRFDQLFGLQSGIQNALAQSFLGERELGLQAGLGAASIKAQEDAAGDGLFADIVGTAASILPIPGE